MAGGGYLFKKALEYDSWHDVVIAGEWFFFKKKAKKPSYYNITEQHWA